MQRYYRKDLSSYAKIVGDVPITVVETMTIREVVRIAIRLWLKNIIIKSESQIAINSMTGNIQALGLISI